MRIITGKLRGMNLFSPKNMDIRPTADRVKESVFNILGYCFEGTRVLDLFSGTGNLGIEAWSRGADSVVFVDNNRNSLQLLEKNINKAGVSEFVTAIHGDAEKIIKRLAQQGYKFNYIFCDPPYNKGYANSILSTLDKNDILKCNGMIIMEHAKEELVDLTILNRLLLFRKEQYGDTTISFFKEYRGE